MPENAPEPTELELLKRLTKTLDSLRVTLEANEKRRRCLWCLDKIGQGMSRLKQSSPNHERTLAEIFEALDCYANLAFETVEDLDALSRFLSLVLGGIEEIEKSGSPEDYGRYTKLCYEILDELRTLDEGDPPGARSAAASLVRSVAYPERQDADRKAVRERAAQRVLDSITNKKSHDV